MTSFRTLLPLSLFVICLGADAQDAPGSDLVRSPIRASIGEDARADRDWHVAWLHDTREHRMSGNDGDLGEMTARNEAEGREGDIPGTH